MNKNYQSKQFLQTPEEGTEKKGTTEQYMEQKEVKKISKGKKKQDDITYEQQITFTVYAINSSQFLQALKRRIAALQQFIKVKCLRNQRKIVVSVTKKSGFAVLCVHVTNVKRCIMLLTYRCKAGIKRRQKKLITVVRLKGRRVKLFLRVCVIKGSLATSLSLPINPL